MITLSPLSIILASCALSCAVVVVAVVLALLTVRRPGDNGLRYEWQMNRKGRRQ